MIDRESLNMRGLTDRNRVRTLERIEREKQLLDLFAVQSHRVGRELAEKLGVNVLTVHRTISRLRANGHRIGGGRGYGYLYSGGPQ